jgi:predicted RNase H-like HicB family nuclease
MLSDDFKKEYPALLSYGYEGNLWVANFVGLPGCWVEGTDRQDVVERAPAMLAKYLKGCEASGISVPPSMDADEIRETGLGEVLMIKPDINAASEDE